MNNIDYLVAKYKGSWAQGRQQWMQLWDDMRMRNMTPVDRKEVMDRLRAHLTVSESVKSHAKVIEATRPASPERLPAGPKRQIRLE